MFTFLTMLNSPLHWWNCTYKLPWNYILWLSSNQRDPSQILSFRLLLKSQDQSTVHSCTNVSEQHPYKVTDAYNASLFGELLGKLGKLSYTWKLGFRRDSDDIWVSVGSFQKAVNLRATNQYPISENYYFFLNSRT